MIKICYTIGFRGCRNSRLTQVSYVGAHGCAPLSAGDKAGFGGAQPCAPTTLNQNQVGFCDTLFSPRASPR